MLSNDTTPLKHCTKCKQEKPATTEYFHRDKKRPDGFYPNCKVCENARRRKPRPIARPGHKFCSRCKQEKPATIEYFNHHKGHKDSFASRCRICNKEYSIAWNAKNRARARANGRIYYVANKERMAEYNRAYRAANRELAKVRSREWYAANRERAAEGKKQWNVANRESRRASEHRREANKRNAGGDHTAADVKRQYKAQKGKCYYCHVKVGGTYHTDHVIPLSRGGSNGPENIVIACPHCNSSKQDRMPHEWPQGNRLL